MNPFFEMGAALLLDAVVGQPRWLAAAHPRRLIMMLSSFLEGVLRDRMSFELRTAGAVMAIAASTAVALAALLLSALGPVARVALMYLALSSRCLPDRAAQVDEALRRHDLSLARDRVAGMTEWDVDRMSEQDVAAAAIESLAQGAPGATVAPALYMALGLPFGVGPALGWLWVAAQALYARAGGDGWAYVDFGQFTRALYRGLARPADWMLAALSVPAAGLCRLSAVGAAAGLRVRRPGESAALAAAAGALGVRLGGDVRRGGVVRHRRHLGAGRIAQPADIRRAMRLIGCACALSAIALWALAGLTWWAAR